VSADSDELQVDAGDTPPDPEELEAAAEPAAAEISPQTTLGSVHLTVSDLERSLGYYQDAIGLRVLEQGGGRARLGVEERELLVLVEEAGARPAIGYTGLYHFALLLPERQDLARWIDHAARDQVPLVGASDHFVSEALYLSDPDGHGIEIYWDRPRQAWEGQVAARMTTLPLDIPGILGELESATDPFGGLPQGTIMGHVHLKVSAIPETVAFYRDLLGFALMAQLGSQAAFLAAGGYHHHFGANTWESAGASAPPPGSAALRHATLVLPDKGEYHRLLTRLAATGKAAEESADGVFVQDPSGNTLELAVV
jgi:catechol 2,3-dioxygenase